MLNLVVSGAALLLACVGFFVYDQVSFRQNLVHTLSAQAQIIGSNSLSALLFNDPQAASETLSALKNSPSVSSAGILTADHHPFAQYARDNQSDALFALVFPKDRDEAYEFGKNHVILTRRILSEGKLVGFVYIYADLREIHDRLRRYTLIAITVLLVSLIFGLAISASLGKAVAEPIIALANTAQRVSRNKDYSVRVPPRRGRDELATLIDSFNQMLREIQRRDSALQKAHDELEQRVAERTRDLVSANRELEAFSYSVSHDLRGPLDALNGFTYVLSKKHADRLDNGGKEALQGIRAASNRMSELIDDLLNLSRVSTTSMHREEVDLSRFARSIMEELCREDPERKIDFIAPQSSKAYGDAGLLRIVLENLLRNAWKYTSHHDHARVEFGEEQDQGQTWYFVKDDGSGFDSRSAARLFQPFHRLHSGIEFPGNGIGLATVRRIIQRHGGEVRAEGEVEQGAKFSFTLETNRVPAKEPGEDPLEQVQR
jgi:signal transduction histidine kinase